MDMGQMRTPVLYLISALLVGCGAATRVSVPVTRAAEIDLKNIDKIAVGEIRGRGSGTLEALGDLGRVVTGGETKKTGSERFSAELVEALFESERFEVLDYSDLKMGFSPINPSMSASDAIKNEVERGRLLGNVGVVSGTILRYDYDQESSHEDFKKKDKKTGKVTTTRRYYREATATVSVSLRVVNAGTSEVLATRKFSASDSGKVMKDGSRPDRIPSEPLFDACRARITRSFVRMISPYTERVYVSFETDKEIPELDHGFRMVKLGDWDGAADIFRRVVEIYAASPLIHKAYYNLGLSHMYTDRFDEARTAFKKAYAAKPSGKYSLAIANLNKRIENRRRLEEQRQVDPEEAQDDAEPVERHGQPETWKGPQAE